MARKDSITVNLQPHIAELVRERARALDRSDSNYVRQLIYADLGLTPKAAVNPLGAPALSPHALSMTQLEASLKRVVARDDGATATRDGDTSAPKPRPSPKSQRKPKGKRGSG